ncbi:hypothetical protein CALCODRAFT_555925 [Calocera cornea HHB12733]|uniref:JmjC domain-containing protein n=1 Tax=Calocera cornea HHB12733 TaxID=1353952 RepID=A0A165F8T6_9BASI|nr:hypothetical protein CALCODRAFT_555925 [Calocera cornea HHB12733]
MALSTAAALDDVPSSAEIAKSLLPNTDVDMLGADSWNDASAGSSSAPASQRKKGRQSTSSVTPAKLKPSHPRSSGVSPVKPPQLDSSFPFKSTAPIPRPGFLAMPTLDASLPIERLRIKMMEHEEKGIPLVVRGFHKLPGWNDLLFTPEWMITHGQPGETISVRNVYNKQDSKMPLTEFIKRCRNASDIIPGEEERYYGKDGLCPPQWEAWLSSSNVVPKHILPFGSDDVFALLEPKDRAETLMTYFGVGGTHTPCHKDLCASVGQNLMVHTENEGSAVWYMTARDDAAVVSEYFHGMGQEIDLETHVASELELKAAPFKMYMHRQERGDLICVPQKSCHQVINEGGITIKLSWSRMLMSSLDLAYKSELPIYHRVCRPEIYSVKLLIHSAVLALTQKLSQAMQGSGGEITPRVRSLRDTLKPLVMIYTEMIVSAWDMERKGEPTTFDPAQQYRLSCDFCGADIFQSYFECRDCDEDGNEPVTICSACYVEGRSCVCEVMQPVHVRPFKMLLEARNTAVAVLNQCLWEQEKLIENYSYEELESDESPHVHQAAVILAKSVNLNLDETAKCREAGTHEVPAAYSVTCSGCHKRSCLTHLLKSGRVHPAAGLLWSRNGKTFHTTHMSFKHAYSTAVDKMKTSRWGIEMLEGWVRLSHAAITYQRCRPYVNQRLTMGFFDEDYDHPLTVAKERPLPQKGSSRSKGKKRALDETIAGDDLESNTSVPAPPKAIPASKKRKISQPSSQLSNTAAGAVIAIKQEPGPSPSMNQLPHATSTSATSATSASRTLAASSQNTLGITSSNSLLGPVTLPNPSFVPEPNFPQHSLAPTALPPPSAASLDELAGPLVPGIDNDLLVRVVKEVSDELSEIRKHAEDTQYGHRTQLEALMAEYKATMEARFRAQEEAHASYRDYAERTMATSDSLTKTLTAQVSQLKAQLQDAQARVLRNEAIIDRMIGSSGVTSTPPSGIPSVFATPPSSRLNGSNNESQESSSITKPTSNGRFIRRPDVL